jgi:hypothetical protein
MVEHFRIVNWRSFQHYKERNPPWIKLHRELLTSRAWISADDANRALMVALMLIAADTDNLIPADPAYIRRRAYLNTEPDFSRLLEVGFLERASTLLATCKQDARPETETETETEKTKPPRGSKILKPTATPKPTAKSLTGGCDVCGGQKVLHVAPDVPGPRLVPCPNCSANIGSPQGEYDTHRPRRPEPVHGISVA